MLQPIGIPAIFKHVVSELAHGVEVSVGVVQVWGLCAKANGKVRKKQYYDYEPMYTLLCHIVTSRIPSQGVRTMKIKRGPLVYIISRMLSFRKCDESAHRRDGALATAPPQTAPQQSRCWRRHRFTTNGLTLSFSESKWMSQFRRLNIHFVHMDAPMIDLTPKNRTSPRRHISHSAHNRMYGR
jgi:hypothetical protein